MYLRKTSRNSKEDMEDLLELGDVFSCAQSPDDYLPHQTYIVNLMAVRQCELLATVDRLERYSRELEKVKVVVPSKRPLLHHRFVSKGALKLLNMLNILDMIGREKIQNSLDLAAGPGGMSQVLLEVSNHVDAVVWKEGLKLHPSVRRLVTVRSDECLASVAKAGTLTEISYDIVVADGASGGVYSEGSLQDFLNNVFYPSMSIILSNRSLSNLSILKGFFYEGLGLYHLVHHLKEKFQFIYLVKPQFSYITNNEFYLVLSKQALSISSACVTLPSVNSLIDILESALTSEQSFGPLSPDIVRTERLYNKLLIESHSQ